MQICKFQAPLKYRQVKNQYLVDDAEIIVGDDTSVLKLAHLVVMMAGSGLKSAQR